MTPASSLSCRPDRGGGVRFSEAERRHQTHALPGQPSVTSGLPAGDEAAGLPPVPRLHRLPAGQCPSSASRAPALRLPSALVHAPFSVFPEEGLFFRPYTPLSEPKVSEPNDDALPLMPTASFLFCAFFFRIAVTQGAFISASPTKKKKKKSLNTSDLNFSAT